MLLVTSYAPCPFYSILWQAKGCAEKEIFVGCGTGISPAQVDLSVRRNGTLPVVYTFTSDGTTPVDLTGWWAVLQVRSAPNTTGTPLIGLDTRSTATANGSSLTLNATAGQVSLLVANGDVLTLPGATVPFPTELSYDLVLGNNSGQNPYITGMLTVDPAVSL